MKTFTRTFLASPIVLLIVATTARAEDPWVVYDSFEGPGKGKHIVLISGDEEYRSEESIPQLGKILAKHHGFKCTVLFAIDPRSGEIDPYTRNNIPGLEALGSADLMIVFLRFRTLPDDQMKHIDDYLKSGKPLIGMRTSTHAFMFDPEERPRVTTSYSHYGTGYSGPKHEWRDGFGRFILGETWVSHWGGHRRQGTRGVPASPDVRSHPILRGIVGPNSIFGLSDVYEANPGGDSKPLVLGQITETLDPDSPVAQIRRNRPDQLQPVVWTKTYKHPESDKTGKVVNTTMGASEDLLYEGTRRILVNAAYWLLDMEVPAEGTKVDLVGDYKPTEYRFFGDDEFPDWGKPSDHVMSP